MSGPSHSRRLLSGVSLVSLLLLAGACSRKRDPAEVYAGKYKTLMVSWKREVESAAASLDTRIAPIPRRERRVFLVNEMKNEAAIHERTLASLKALGPPPEDAREMVAASREVLSYLAASGRARAAATSNGDRAAMAKLDEEFEREIARLGVNLVEARNAVARKAGLAQMTEAEILSGSSE